MALRALVLERLFDCLNRTLSIDVAVEPDMDFVRELGLDSIQVMELLMELEDEFDIVIPLNVLTDVHTPAQLALSVFSLMEHAGTPVR